VLDCLNRIVAPFIPLLVPEGAVLVNAAFIVGVTETPPHERSG
jgi:hypothetical protein